MISTRFCQVCGAANEETRTHCFACGGLLPLDSQQNHTVLRGRYRLGPTLGSGGYSAVYRGRDIQAGDRAVAIKQITLGGLNAEETIEATSTYNREVEALSELSHPQIPRLFDHFSDPDHWYLVLEYIEGQTLESYLDARETQGKRLQIEEILGMAVQICVVLNYLHSCHPPLIFRDLKPDNLMRTPAGKLYFIDFGIARRYTPGQRRDTQSLGSPGYAAPEQYGRAQTDERTDLYGLGALLHRLLSGRDPSLTPRGLPPLRLNGQPGSLEFEQLVNRLLSVDPVDRPASARDVLRELERIRQRRGSILDGQRIWQPPVPQNPPPGGASQIHLPRSTPPQPQQQRRRRPTRRRVLTAIGATAAVTLLGGGLYAFSSNNRGIVIDAPPLPSFSQPLYTYTGHTDTVNALAWSPDSLYIASTSADKTIQVWNIQNGQDSYNYTSSQAALNAIAWSSDDKYIAAAGDSGNAVLLPVDNPQVIAGPASTSENFAGPVNALAWMPEVSARTFAVGTSSSARGTILIQQVEKQTIVPGVVTELQYQQGNILSLAYSPDGPHLASGAQDGTVVIWDVGTNQRVFAIYRGHQAPVTGLAWLPNSPYIVSSSEDKTARIWDVTTGATLLVYREHSTPINAVAVSSDGKYVASADDKGIVHVWSAFDGHTQAAYTGHSASVRCIAWSPDGFAIASGSDDKTVQVWRVPQPSS